MGTGKACAGQSNVNDESNVVVKVMLTWVVDSLGGTRPIGSEEYAKRIQL